MPALQNTVDLRNANVYITLQACNEAVYSRAQKDHFLANQPATSDNDITGYRWLFIDMDPERVTGVSSTDEELKESARLANRVYKYMRDLGFSEPLKAVSGNGCHLLYKINVSSKPENVQLLQRCLETLALLFNNDHVKIDTVNYNPSRVCKLYGTLAQKGSSTEERPFRMSYIKNPDADIQVNEKVYLEKLAAQYPVIEQPEPAKYNNYQPESFDVERFMNDHGIQYTAKPYKGGVKYVLKECPFDHQHTAPDSAIFKLSSGAIGFRCLHNSCADKTWQDVRKLFEPDAYERKSAEYDQHIELGLAQHNRMKQQQLEAAAANFQQKIQQNAYTREQAQAIQAQLQRQNADLQALNQRLSGEFQNETEKYNKALRDSIQHFLASYNQSKKFTLILSKAGDNILYADKVHDITKDVIAGLNKAYKSSPEMKAAGKEKKK